MRRKSALGVAGIMMISISLLLSRAALATGNSRGAQAATPDFSGAWIRVPDKANFDMTSKNKSTDKVFTLRDGTPIPLLPEAEKVYRRRVAQGETLHPFANTVSQCLPYGTPGNMMGAPPYPIQIVQRPEVIVILSEEHWHFRIINMDQKHPDDVSPTFQGDSVGRWEGDTLVIDTIGLRADTTLNFSGLPHSEDMRVIERLRKTSPTTLVDSIEILDPKTFSKAFTFVSTFEKFDGHLLEYICEKSQIVTQPDGTQAYGPLH